MGGIFVDHSKNSKKRPNAHVIGEQAVKFLMEILPNHWVCRQFNPDYGIDLDVELFSETTRRTLGEHVLLQVKGVESATVKTVNVKGNRNTEVLEGETRNGCLIDVIQYQIETGLLATVEEMGSAVPVLLSVVDLSQRRAYLVCLNDYIEKVIIPRGKDYQKQKTITLNIPIANVIDADHGREIFEWYGKRAKLYAFFNQVNYQLNELEYCSCANEKVELAKRFARILGRLDVWHAGKYWATLMNCEEELEYFYTNGITKQSFALLEADKKAGMDISTPEFEGTWCVGDVSLEEIHTVQGIHLLWQNLNGLSHSFEELVKERFLPTPFL